MDGRRHSKIHWPESAQENLTVQLTAAFPAELSWGESTTSIIHPFYSWCISGSPLYTDGMELSLFCDWFLSAGLFGPGSFFAVLWQCRRVTFPSKPIPPAQRRRSPVFHVTKVVNATCTGCLEVRNCCKLLGISNIEIFPPPNLGGRDLALTAATLGAPPGHDSCRCGWWQKRGTWCCPAGGYKSGGRCLSHTGRCRFIDVRWAIKRLTRGSFCVSVQRASSLYKQAEPSQSNGGRPDLRQQRLNGRPTGWN